MITSQVRNVVLLALSQAASFSGNTLLIATSVLVGNLLAGEKALSALPQGVFLAATTLATIPMSHFMRRRGRKMGFLFGAVVVLCGSLLAGWAIVQGEFWLFVAACALNGAGNAASLYYRFAAAELADDAFRPKAISLVLAGGVVAAIAGPELSKLSRDLLAPHLFAGTYLVGALLPVIAMAFVAFVSFGDVKPKDEPKEEPSGRRLGEIVRQPAYLASVAAAICGYAVMAFVMTAAPLAVLACDYGYDDAAVVIEWHVLGMFAPAFFTGHLIARFGVVRIMLAGCLLLLLAVGINLSGVQLANFWTALVSLGVGWNFLYVGATTLLTRTYTPAERARAQGFNEFLVFGCAAIASFSAGAVQNLLGWTAVNVIAALPILLALGAVSVLLSRGFDKSH